MSNQLRLVRRTQTAPQEESEAMRQCRRKLKIHVNIWIVEKFSKKPSEAFLLEDPQETKWQQPMPLELNFREQLFTLNLVGPDKALAPYVLPHINIRSGSFRLDLTEIKLIAVVDLVPNMRTMYDIWLTGQKMPVRIVCLTDEASQALEYELWVDEFYVLEEVETLEQMVGPRAYRSIKEGYEKKGLIFPTFYATVSEEDRMGPCAPFSESTTNQILKLVRQQYPNKPKKN